MCGNKCTNDAHPFICDFCMMDGVRYRKFRPEPGRFKSFWYDCLEVASLIVNGQFHRFVWWPWQKPPFDTRPVVLAANQMATNQLAPSGHESEGLCARRDCRHADFKHIWETALPSTGESDTIRGRCGVYGCWCRRYEKAEAE